MTSRAVSASALIGAVAGLLGAASAVVLLTWPADAPAGLVRYPFSETGFYVAQSWFFIHHLGLLAGVVAFVVSGAPGPGRVARMGGWLAVAGTTLLTIAELNTMRYADWLLDDANAGLMGVSYAVACNLVGVGMILAGVGVLRSGRWAGWHRWTPVVLGVAQFVVLTPGLFLGFAAARVAIGVWMLMYGALGWSAWVELRPASVRETHPAVA
jgi:hypothetical protein